MRKYYVISLLLSFLITQQSFAWHDKSSDIGDASVKQCEMIVQACLDAGFTESTKGKAFWLDCMKPILWGKTVAGVKIDSKDVGICRKSKISKMKEELKQLEQVQKQTH